jgi:hypothetical protein
MAVDATRATVRTQLLAEAAAIVGASIASAKTTLDDLAEDGEDMARLFRAIIALDETTDPSLPLPDDVDNAAETFQASVDQITTDFLILKARASELGAIPD